MPQATRGVLFIQGGGEGAYAEDQLLADSLKRALGPKYDVRYPRMPDESNPNVEAWGPKISSELAKIPKEVILVAHSVGGSILLQYLANDTPGNRIAGLFMLAAPTWDGDQWNFDDLRYPPGLAEKLAPIPRIFIYHCRDDDTVPFAHLALHGAHIPQAITRAISHGGHQFGNDLTQIGRDIRANDSR